MKLKDFPYEHLDMQDIREHIHKFQDDFLRVEDGGQQFQIHQDFYAYIAHVDTMLRLCEFRHSVDTTDDYYEKENNYCDEISPQIACMKADFKKLLLESSYREELEQKIGKNAFLSMELMVKAEDERLVELKQKENELISAYDALMAQVSVHYEGGTYNLSQMKKFLTDGDRQVRIKAYEAYTGALAEIADRVEEIYDKMVQNRTAQAAKVGETDYVTLGYWNMNRNCYGRKEIETFRQAIKKYWVPLAEKVQENRRKRLGIPKLFYYDEDVAFSYGNPAPTGSSQEILQGGQKMYAEMSQETKDFFDTLMEKELFDVLARPGKKNGGYMEYLPEYKLPFIFANFNGTSGDVDVVTHECGHAFQAYLVASEEIAEHQEITMDVAEIHSMTMEFFAEPWCHLFFGDKARDYILMHLEDAITFIPYGCMVDEFQQKVYENPAMSIEQRNTLWLSLEKEYRPHMDYQENTYYGPGRFWQKQLHIFDCPFYYIDYCFAQLCALQFKLAMDEDRDDAWKRYVSLCKYSAKGNFLEALQVAGLKSPFAEENIKEIAEKLAGGLLK